MFDIGWSEMAIIMLLALIIIGPKDLPRVARTIGQWVRKGRMLAREFQTSLEDMAKEAELDDVKKEIEKVGKTDLKGALENTIDPKGDLKKAFDTSGDDKGEETVGKVLNGGGEAKQVAADTKAESAAPAKTNQSSKTTQTAKPASPKTAAAAAKPSKPKATASRKKPPAAAKKPAAAAAAAKKPAAKKTAAPRKRAAKPASTAKSGDTPSSADDGGATMAAKSS